jgi:dTDP-L-rhamnose 4-epimerase
VTKVLVTGGAGFIGSHLLDALVKKGHTVRVLDNLTAQVHGKTGQVPDYYNREAHLIIGDVREKRQVLKALEGGVDVVYHLASATGVGQSMYEIKEYADVNIGGTATLLDTLAMYPPKKLILASSRAVYGEGEYECGKCGMVYPAIRNVDQLSRGEWDVRCPHCGLLVRPVPTGEDKPLHPGSIYAVSKRTQEELCLCAGQAYGIPVVVLRYFNVYGPRQSLLNPYTGIITIFATHLLSGRPPEVYEDGEESRDFVHVDDVTQANLLAMEKDAASGQIFNVGTQHRLRILDLAHILVEALGSELRPKVVPRFRLGDVRHCYADISRTREILGYAPKVTIEFGIRRLIPWILRQAWTDRSDKAWMELERRGLARVAYD